jgi:phosphatidate cytidylyltransferase
MATGAGWRPFTIFGILWAVLFVLSVHFPDSRTTPILLATTLVIPALWLLSLPHGERSHINWLWSVCGIFYIGWTLSHFLSLRGLECGRDWVIFALFATFAVDTFAYFIGRAWGRHPMAPRISPGKSWEGAIGGLGCGIAAAFALNAILGLPVSYAHIAILGLLIGIFAQIGDIVESALKRSTRVKDSGRLIPGHGGILDRLDSIVFTIVLVYYYVWYIIV